DLLFVRTRNEIGIEAAHTLEIKPADASAYRCLIMRHVKDDKIDEVGDPRIGSTARLLISGDDNGSERSYRLHLMVVEESSRDKFGVALQFFRRPVITEFVGCSRSNICVFFFRLTLKEQPGPECAGAQCFQIFSSVLIRMRISVT